MPPRCFRVWLEPWLSWRRLNLAAIIVAAYLAGIALSLAGLAPVLARFGLLAAALLLAAAVLFRPASSLRLLLLVAGAFALLGLSVGSLRLAALEETELVTLAGRRVTLEVTVERTPRERNGKISFFGRVDSGEYRDSAFTLRERVLVELYCRDDCAGAAAVSEGQRLRLTGTLGTVPSTPEADFDYGRYLARRGIHTVMTVDDAGAQPAGARGGIGGIVDELRRHAKRSLELGNRGAAGGLLKGMVLGDASDVPDRVVDDLRDAGLLHLLAVSGQNVVLLGFVIMLIFRAMMMPRTAAAWGAIIAVCAYVPLTGADPSIVRAGIVGILGLLATILGRQAERCYLLAVSAAALLTHNPNNLLEPGFQLSYAAVLAIFFVAPALRRPLGFLPPLLAEAVAIAAAAGLATAPITLAHFQQVPLVTVPANVAAAPVAGPVMFIGVLSIIAAAVSPSVSWLLNLVAALCTAYLVEVARFFASIPGAVYVGTAPGGVAILYFYAMLIAMTALIRNMTLHRLAGGLARGRSWALPAAILLLLGVIACFGGAAPAPPDTYTVSVLDVGQGDTILIQVPGGATVLVDGGPGSVVLDRLEESGVTRIDALVLSHPHADHVAGLTMVLEKYDVGVVYDASSPSSSPFYAEFLRLVERKGIEYRKMRAGDEAAFGELVLTVYAPGQRLSPDDINANSIVMVASYQGMDVLMAGDAESDVLSSLDLPEVEALKVSHHGSRDDGLAGVLAAIKPQASVISVGAGNEYGHPAESTLQQLRDAGSGIYRTDQDGTVRLSLVDGRMVVTTARD
ncbi:MAG: DNA internalization-related competence protein ComEC/Rec2 [Thermoleophilia bacterium]